ncbi:hypothetical protein Q6350_03310 [Isoptericola sp. b515]|uniref:hypothetical protein n=1 Tax=Isoptericola sp. b515 TaxID=3064652 RepID=UPI002713F7C3|nr:hypothetical protein [Isoptericola sp. b515]MDO8147451.1 hypothetical protein [Isoptericola sp. b515]
MPVRIEQRTPFGTVDRAWQAEALGTDEWGDWFAVPDHGLLLLPVADPWVAWFRHDGSVRVDVATEVSVASTLSSFVGLGLDVVRDADGTVRAPERAGFVRRSPSYPRAWVDLAWEAREDVRRDVARAAEPFGRAPDAWLDRAPRPTTRGLSA